MNIDQLSIISTEIELKKEADFSLIFSLLFLIGILPLLKNFLTIEKSSEYENTIENNIANAKKIFKIEFYCLVYYFSKHYNYSSSSIVF